MTCPYCKNVRVVETSDGMIACRYCLGTCSEQPYENDNGSMARARELRRIAELLENPDLAVWFTPDAIRDSFDSYSADDPRRQWMEQATEAELLAVSEACIDSDILWRTFHQVIELAVEERMPLTTKEA